MDSKSTSNSQNSSITHCKTAQPSYAQVLAHAHIQSLLQQEENRKMESQKIQKSQEIEEQKRREEIIRKFLDKTMQETAVRLKIPLLTIWEEEEEEGNEENLENQKTSKI